MPNIIIKNEAGEDVTYNNVNTVRFQTDEGAVASYKYNDGETEVVPDPSEYDYEVVFLDDFGNELKHYYVDAGDSVEAPTYEREGFIFHKWIYFGNLDSVDRDIICMPVTEEYVNPEPITIDEELLNKEYDYYDVDILVDGTYYMYLCASTSGSFTVDWGDGTTTSTGSSYTYYDVSHVFSKGTYEIKVYYSGSGTWASFVNTDNGLNSVRFCYNRALFSKIVYHSNANFTNRYTNWYVKVQQLILQGAQNSTNFFIYSSISECYCADGEYNSSFYLFNDSSTTVQAMRVPKNVTSLTIGGSIRELYLPDSITDLKLRNFFREEKIRLPQGNKCTITTNNADFERVRNLYIPENVSFPISSMFYSCLCVRESFIFFNKYNSITDTNYYMYGRKVIYVDETNSSYCLPYYNRSDFVMLHIDAKSDTSYCFAELPSVPYINYNKNGYNYGSSSLYSSWRPGNSIKMISFGDDITYAPRITSCRLQHLDFNKLVSCKFYSYNLAYAFFLSKLKIDKTISFQYQYAFYQCYIKDIDIYLNPDWAYDIFYSTRIDKATIHGDITKRFFTETYFNEVYIKDCETISDSGSGNKCFYSCRISMMDLCDEVSSVSSGFYDTSILQLYVRNSTPPTLSDTDLVNKSCIIHVPADSLEAYQTATNWSAYAYKIIGDL